MIMEVIGGAGASGGAASGVASGLAAGSAGDVASSVAKGATQGGKASTGPAAATSAFQQQNNQLFSGLMDQPNYASGLQNKRKMEDPMDPSRQQGDDWSKLMTFFG